MPAKKRILFVDDELRVLRGLRRMLDSMTDEWEMSFANSGQEALDLLAKEPFDVIVSDMRMPGMTGVELLNEVRRRHPEVVRLALSGQSSKESVLHSVGPIHQYLPKPCDEETLKSTLVRLCAVRNLLAVDPLQPLLAQLEYLPSLPSLYERLMRECRAQDGSLQEVGRIISQDMGMSAKLLQLVNSAFFGMPRHIASPAQAVVALGMETVRALALTVCVFSQFEEAAISEFGLRPLWRHSAAAGFLAKRIATAEGMEAKAADHALMAGLLHDTGKLVFAAMLPEQYRGALELAAREKTGVFEAERRQIGASHAEVGAYLLGLWGFPYAVIEAVAYHHCPVQVPVQQFSVLTAVHVAEGLSHEPGARDGDAASRIDRSYLEGLGVAERLAGWREMACASLDEVTA